MSSIFETITGELGGGTLAALGNAVGASPDQTKSVVGAAVPAIIAGLAKNASTPDGAAALNGALDSDHGPNLMDHLGPLAGSLLGGGGNSGGGGGFGALAGLAGGLLGGGGNANASSGGGGLAALLPVAISAMQGGNAAGAPKALNGGGILGHIFGGAQSKVADDVAKASGVDASIVAKLLPILAPIVMSALGTLKKKQGLDASGVSSLLQGEAQAVAPAAPSDDGFGVDDLMKVGGQLASSGLLSKLF
jgi:hypothetical protein